MPTSSTIKVGIAVMTSLTLAAAVAGCATPADLRAQPPEVEHKSARSSKDVAICIADKWENALTVGNLTITMRPTSSGYTVLGSNPNVQYVIVLSDVNDTSSGSQTFVFVGSYPSVLSQYYLTGAQECQR